MRYLGLAAAHTILVSRGVRPEGDTDLGKKLVFISHIGEESELAILISDEIKSAFLGMLDTFVSSDGESIPSGSRWLQKIDTALKKASILISLCSPQSVDRPWINFEAGASWMTGIPSVPLCHSGLSKDQLKMPLAALESADLNNEDDLRKIFDELTKVLGSQKPDVDLKSFIEKCRPLVKQYTYLNTIKQAIQTIVNLRPKLKSLFVSGESSTRELGLKGYEYNEAAPALDLLKKEGLITCDMRVMLMGADDLRGYDITVTDKYLKEVLPLVKWD